MKYHIQKRLRHIWQRFKWLVVLYLFFWAIWLSMKLCGDWWANLLDKNWHYGDGFFKGWFSSLTEDLIFFGTGFLGLILSTKLLRDESFDVRVSSLANGENMNKNVDFYLKQQVEELLSFNRASRALVEIQKIDAESKNIFVLVDVECEVVNMCEDDTVKARIRTFVEPGLPVNGDYGHISHLSITHHLAAKHRNKITQPGINYIIPNGHNLDLNELKGDPYQRDVNYTIYPDSVATWKLCYSIWLPINGDRDKNSDWFFNRFTGYTEGFRLDIHNKLKVPVYYDFRYMERRFEADNEQVRENKEEVHPGVKKNVAESLLFKKNDNFEMFFYTQLKEKP